MRDRTSLIVAAGVVVLAIIGVVGVFSESIAALISPPLPAAPDSAAQPTPDAGGPISRT